MNRRKFRAGAGAASTLALADTNPPKVDAADPDRAAARPVLKNELFSSPVVIDHSGSHNVRKRRVLSLPFTIKQAWFRSRPTAMCSAAPGIACGVRLACC